jgi:hypothetical protein
MDIYFDRLKRRAGVLGNHYRKYIAIIENNIDGLMGRLEYAGVVERVHLWASAHEYREEISTIAKLRGSNEEKLADLGCYFAIQFLQMNLNALDALMLEVTTSENRHSLYKRFMLRVGHDFRRLTAAYMEQLLNIFLPADQTIEFAFLGVGTRSDQDDIDIGVIDRGDEGRELLNRAISRMNAEMFKKAVSLHFHLSEHVGSPTSYSASIEEYLQLLDNEIHDFVIINEMLGAARIVGSRRLFFDFRRQVTLRYYYTAKSDEHNKYHEGYLRGIVGEARSFMLRELSKDYISPKGDGLRMIKTSLYAAKTIFNLRQVNAWAILEELQKRDKKRQIYYEDLEGPLTFLEIFRYLYQLLIAQEEEIYLHQKSTRDNLSLVAEAMGYRPIGAAPVTDFLITDYYKNIRKAKNAIRNSLPHLSDHLASITIFNRLLWHKKATNTGEKQAGNLAFRFLEEAQFFRGTRFWDDVIAILQQKDGQLLKRLANDICSFPMKKREQILQMYIEWGWNSFIATFSFVVLLHQYRNELADHTLYQKFNDFLLMRMSGTTEEAQRISTVFKHYPKLLHEYIDLLTTSQQKKLYQWLGSDVWDKELLPARDRLRYLLKLHFGTSKYFQRAMDRVLDAHPEYLTFLNDSHRLLLIGKGSLAEVEREPGIRQKLKKLVFFHDFEFFRVCLNTLAGASSESVALEFTEFSDTYLRLLFDACKQEIDERRGSALQTRDLLGVFVAGGHGQMQAFDDDYDLIILLNSDDESIRSYCSSIISRMHKEIVNCGIMPHYRLSDFTASYICTFNQLKYIIGDGAEDRFIDKSLLLGARMIVGSTILQQAFEKEIIEPFILHQKQEYIKAMQEEMQQRHHMYQINHGDGLNLKEIPGGLRDIEMLLFICRALYRLQEPSNFLLMRRLASGFPKRGRYFQRLHKAYDFLRMLRNLNRLTVAADDILDPEYLENLTEFLNIAQRKNISSKISFSLKIQATIALVNKTVGNIMEKIVFSEMEK